MFPVLMALLLLVLFLKLWYIQVVKRPELQRKARASASMTIKHLAPRGLIYDRNGKLIAGIRPEVVITAKPGVVNKNQGVLARVAQILQVDEKKLAQKVREGAWRPYVETPIYVGAKLETGVRIAEDWANLPGIGVQTQPMRAYPETKSFTHVLGYVWTPNENDIERLKKQGLEPLDYVGKTGVELAYEDQLLGKPGEETLAVDARRRPTRVDGRDAATAGNRLYLTIDADLQEYTTKLFGEHNYVGGAVALDPRTGEVLALVSSPTFDQSVFSGGISDAEWKTLNTDENQPMWNRATKSAYPPGSTFKIVTTIAAMETGKFRPDLTFFCNGGVKVGKTTFRCLGHHGSIGFHEAFAKSCNSYFYQLGRMVGEKALCKAALDCGLGQSTGFELGGSPGVVPTEEWVKEHKSDGKWYPGDTLNLSIGQGFLNTTPLQMASVAALVANDGILYRPHLVREIRDPQTQAIIQSVSPQVTHEVTGPPEFWSSLRSALVEVIDTGTAKSAQIRDVHWAGKTGSAEHQHGTKTHSWFVGFAPADRPTIAVCVLVESGGHGGEVSAPIARDIVKRYLNSSKADANLVASSSSSAALTGSRVR
jgi:penicillin-binding protein 2